MRFVHPDIDEKRAVLVLGDELNGLVVGGRVIGRDLRAISIKDSRVVVTIFRRNGRVITPGIREMPLAVMGGFVPGLL